MKGLALPGRVADPIAGAPQPPRPTAPRPAPPVERRPSARRDTVRTWPPPDSTAPFPSLGPSVDPEAVAAILASPARPLSEPPAPPSEAVEGLDLVDDISGLELVDDLETDELVRNDLIRNDGLTTMPPSPPANDVEEAGAPPSLTPLEVSQLLEDEPIELPLIDGRKRRKLAIAVAASVGGIVALSQLIALALS